jgi:hypothetical protein
MIIFRFLLRIRNVSDTICGEYKKKVSFSKYFFPKIVPFKIYVEKYGTARQVTDDDIIIRRTHFACLTIKTTHTLRLRNTYCFFMATKLVRKGHNIVLISTLLSLLYPLLPITLKLQAD